MRLLLIHAKSFMFRALEKAIDEAEEVEESGKQYEFKNALVVFTTIEDGDEKDILAIVERATNEILDVKSKVNAEIIVLYPYAHLSHNLAPPSIAKKILNSLFYIHMFI